MGRMRRPDKKIGRLAAVLLGAAILFPAGGPVLAEGTTPSDVYARVTQINDRLIAVLRKNQGHRVEIPALADIPDRQIYPRHVFQRALDIERMLTAVMRMNSMESEATKTFEVRTYSPDEVKVLIDNINRMVEKIMDVNGVEKNQPLRAFTGKKPGNVYALLDRLESFLIDMGAPTPQPAAVLRRAQVIARLAAQMCTAGSCLSIRRLPVKEIRVKRPIDVYLETYGLVLALNAFAIKSGTEIPGGVLALPPHSGLITPLQVNHLMGTVLADFIAIGERRGFRGNVVLPDSKSAASPRDVWREVSFAHRIVRALSDGL